MATTTAGDPIPAVREDEASGEVAEIFADLRATLGIPLVNLIWRHLATRPHGLLHVWIAVRPLYASSILPRQAAEVRAAATWPSDLALPAFAWDAAGVGREARAEIAGMIAHYNAGNSCNLLGLLAARALLRGEVGQPDHPRRLPRSSPTRPQCIRLRPVRR